MKRAIALLLSITMLLTGCTQSQTQEQNQLQVDETVDIVSTEAVDTFVWEDDIPEYDSLDDGELLGHVEDLIYRETVLALDSEEYFVENVSAVYISKEYLDEVAFNSQSNIYFGYTLAELDELFEGTRYIFTLGEDGQTTVQGLQKIEDTYTETMLKNIAIGTGVILVCVTVSAVTAAISAPAVSMIFAVSAKNGTIMAFSSGGIGAVSAGIVRGIQTGDFSEALEAAAMAGSEGFKWGAVSGVFTGGTQEFFVLKKVTQNGLTMNQAAIIQKESGFPIDVISQLHSMDEYLVYKESGLKPVMINGRIALVQKIDLDFVSCLSDGTEVTNIMRMQNGLPPLDPVTGKAYELHHIHQNPNGTLAVLTQEQHRGNAGVLNTVWKNSPVDHSAAWNKTRQEFWEAFARSVGGT